MVEHDSSVGEGRYLTVCRLSGPGSIPIRGGYFNQSFFLADHTLPTHSEPVWQKMAQSPLNGTTKPVDIEEEGQNPTTDRE